MENFENREQLSLREKYAAEADDAGFLPVSAFATQELKRQSKSVAALLDGEENTEAESNFGEGLTFQGTSGNYPEMKIHIDDLDEFVRRVKEYFGD